jgi:hypothetical protein
MAQLLRLTLQILAHVLRMEVLPKGFQTKVMVTLPVVAGLLQLGGVIATAIQTGEVPAADDLGVYLALLGIGNGGAIYGIRRRMPGG